MIKSIQGLDEVLDFAWELSQNDLSASYPRINSREDLKKELERVIRMDSHDLIAYYHNDILCGVCFYYWISEERYVQTIGFLIKGDYYKIADEFISYISRQLPGHELFIGVPFTNMDANEYFKHKNVKCIEDSIVTRICNLEPQTNTGYDFIEEINKNNFKEYALFHDRHAIPKEMYFNSNNLLKRIGRFRIFAFKQDGEIHGSIFVNAGKEISDVIGLFIDEEYKNKGIEMALLNEMLNKLYSEFGAVKETLYFIDEDSPEELNLALAAGFEIKERYQLYKCLLQGKNREMNNDIIIRPMLVKDLDDALELWKTSFNEGFSSFFDTKEVLERYLKRNPGLSTVVYTNEGKLIGAMLCGHDGRRGSIYHAAVHREYRHKGIGKQMEKQSLEALKKEGITTGFLFINVNNPNAKEFWNAAGWEVVPNIRYLYKQF